MANANENNANKKKPQVKIKWPTVDSAYTKFSKSVIRALSSTEFYDFFISALAKSNTTIQFSNKKVEKTVDTKWINAIDEAMEGFQNILATPRNIIKEEELIVNIANARKANAEAVRHLSQHGALVDEYNGDTGEVRPGRLMQKYREDSIELYENRLVFTVMEQSFHFVKIRHDALFDVMGDEYGAKLKVHTDVQSEVEDVHYDMFLHILQKESAFEKDEKNADVFSNIDRIYRMLGSFMNTQFAKDMAKLPRVKGTIMKTNVLKKTPNYKKIVKLAEFLRGYDDIGYTIRVIEQNPKVDEKFQLDNYHNIMFNYLILKSYLEDENDRQIPVKSSGGKKQTLKPKFIKEIIEELTQDYDLPDVEVRKVLIEELTREQLMKEEEAERRRLVDEQQAKLKAEREAAKKAQEEEKERIKQEKIAEKERQRQLKEEEAMRLKREQLEREQEDDRRSRIFKKEVKRFREGLADQIDKRRIKEEKDKNANLTREDMEEALLSLEERLKRKELEAERLRRRHEKELLIAKQQREEARKAERMRKEAELAEKKRIEEEEQKAKEEAERREKEAIEEAKRIEADNQRIAELRLQIRAEEAEKEAKKQAEIDAQKRAEQEKKDKESLKEYISVLAMFREQKEQILEERKKIREQRIKEALERKAAIEAKRQSANTKKTRK